MTARAWNGAVAIPDYLLPYVPLSWHRMPTTERDEQGQLTVTDTSDRWRAHPVGWTDHDRHGVWVLA